MAQIQLNREPSPYDKQAFKDMLYYMPVIERLKPVIPESLWILLRRQNPETHVKT